MYVSAGRVTQVDVLMGLMQDGSTYRCNHDSGIQMRSALDFCPMQTIEHLAEVCGESGEHFRAGAAHGHEPDAGLCICCRLGVEDEADGIDLCFPPTWQVVAVACALAVVADYDRRLKTHGGGGWVG